MGETYDGNGNPTNYHSQALTYDPENRLTSYSSLQTDGWNGDGLRAWKQTGAASTRTYFLYDGSQPLGEYSSTGALRATNVFGADGLISRLDPSSPVNSGWTYYSFDLRGAVTQRLYANGNPYQTDLYFANGYRSERLLDYSDPWGFGGQAGYVTDLETGLMLCTHRFYDPNVGRFLTRDPMGYDGGINLYGYTQNDPVNEADPEGMQSTDANGDCMCTVPDLGGSGFTFSGNPSPFAPTYNPPPPPDGFPPGFGDGPPRIFPIPPFPPGYYQNGAVQSNPTVVKLKKTPGFGQCKKGDKKACDELRKWLKDATDPAAKREIKQAMKFMGCDPKDRGSGDVR